MAHTTTAMLFFVHYWEVATPEAAEAYWKIMRHVENQGLPNG
jgi:hypothetical protein